jgi:hypothetical protein
MDIDNNNINTVSVKSVNEERRKFRVIWSNAARFAGNEQKGEYKFLLPPPTSLANSHKYPNAIIKIDSFTAHYTSMVLMILFGLMQLLMLLLNFLQLKLD